MDDLMDEFYQLYISLKMEYFIKCNSGCLFLWTDIVYNGKCVLISLQYAYKV